MSSNPYENPEFAKKYVLSQADRSRNRYEWEVTHPATLQFVEPSVERVLDYGCGSGIFTASMTQSARRQLNPALESVGTDASLEMLRYAGAVERHADGVRFQQWDAGANDSELQNGSFDRVMAKLVLNYVSKESLQDAVMPRLRECLSDDGLLVAVLPNPLREASYNTADYQAMNDHQVDVGNFGADVSTISHHHTYEEMMKAANDAGFAYGRVLGLPSVRFEPYGKGFMHVAHPMPMIFDTLNAAKRWVYVFGATEASAETFDSGVARLEAWRSWRYPEIADRAHIRVEDGAAAGIDLPIEVPHDALYDYVGPSDSGHERVVTVSGERAEHMDPRQKIKLVKKLAQRGIRDRASLEAII